MKLILYEMFNVLSLIADCGKHLACICKITQRGSHVYGGNLMNQVVGAFCNRASCCEVSSWEHSGALMSAS